MRYVLQQALMVLSGMSNIEQMEDNISYMKEFRALDDTEMTAVKAVAEVFNSKHMIACTACRYCVEGCPKHISIPDLFALSLIHISEPTRH